MKKPIIVAIILGSVLTAGAAQAKDLCLQSGALRLKFTKVKLPKAGTASTLQGIYVNSLSESSAMTGTAIRRDGGQLEVSVFFHASNQLSGNDFTATWTAAEDLSGTAFYDNDGDFHKDDATFSMTPIDCAEVAVP